MSRTRTDTAKRISPPLRKRLESDATTVSAVSL